MNKGKLMSFMKGYGLGDVNVVLHTRITPPCIAFGVEDDPAHGHWVAIEEEGDTVYLFDSYGTEPGAFYQIPGWSDFIRGKRLIRNVLTIQRLKTNYCGLYCVAYLLLRRLPYLYSFSEACNVLAQDLGPNRDNHIGLASILGIDPAKMEHLVGMVGVDEGDGIDLHGLIGKLPFIPEKGFVAPGYHYLGPYNPLAKQVTWDSKGNILKEMQAPINQVDRIAQTHDIAYTIAAGDLDAKHQADQEMVNSLNLLPESECTKYGRLAKWIINTKQHIGLW